MTDIRDNATAFIASAEPCSPGCLHDHCELSQAVVLVKGMLTELDRCYTQLDLLGAEWFATYSRGAVNPATVAAVATLGFTYSALGLTDMERLGKAAQELAQTLAEGEQ